MMTKSPLTPLIEKGIIHNGPTIPMTHPDGEVELRTFVEAKAYKPEVIIKNNLFPFPHEIYNCTTCKRGTNLYSAIKERYMYWCANDCKKHIGDKYADNCCMKHDMKIKNGIMEGVER
jgi:hypothetical protein